MRKYLEQACPSCKNTRKVRIDNTSKYCRTCRAKINSFNKKPLNILGKKFGKLTVLNLSYIKKSAYWNCRCECGKYKIIHGNRLRSGKTKSCGCLQFSQKGNSRNPSYKIWQGMMSRCYDKKLPHYKRYGGKGIKVCDRWHNFEDFLNDMGTRPEGLTLDRIDPTKDYFKENCKWSTYKEQARSSRHLIEAFGEKKSLIDWQEKTGINWATIRKRIFDLKWPIELALTKKVRQKCR